MYYKKLIALLLSKDTGIGKVGNLSTSSGHDMPSACHVSFNVTFVLALLNISKSVILTGELTGERLTQNLGLHLRKTKRRNA